MRWPALVLAIVAVPAVASAAPKHARQRHKADNMPYGFVWPPSETMTAAARACEARLDDLGVARGAAKAEGHMVDPIAPTPAATDAHQFELGGVAYTGVFGKGPYAMDCQLAAALTELGGVLAQLDVREVRFGSIYRWSKVRVGGKTKDMLSRHALGLAMDVVSFVDRAGHQAVVATDYKREGKTGPLHAIEAAINHSGKFRLVLTPQNDPISHHDHFHLEADVDYRTSES